MKTITYEIPQTVMVRKYDVDIEGLKHLLKTHRRSAGLNARELSTLLGIPLTKVEHWFRNDKYFSIPDPEYWMELKEILSIKTDMFDLPIMTFEERFGVYDSANRVYGTNGISPTITSALADIRIIQTI